MAYMVFVLDDLYVNLMLIHLWTGFWAMFFPVVCWLIGSNFLLVKH